MHPDREFYVVQFLLISINFRKSGKEMTEQCDKLVEQIDYLTAELDIHKMEISRQEDIVNRQQREIRDLKVKLATSLEQIEVQGL